MGDLFTGTGLLAMDKFASGPFTPLHAIDRTQIIFLQTIGVVKPIGVFIGILIPYFAAQCPKIGGAARCPEKPYHFTNGGFECKPFCSDGGKTLLEIKAQAGARNTQGADTGAIVTPRALCQNGFYEVQIVFHEKITTRMK